jgi:8-oxo-dGTP diphosphatase
MLFLVRHAKAGERHDSVDDLSRPLSKAGWKQARALVEPLLEAGATGPLLSSPYVRCRQTLEPLAAELDVHVITDKRLGEGESVIAMIEMITAQPDGAVLCSHGDMIPDSLSGLQRRGCQFIGEPNWKKASVWLIERDREGNALTATSWPPPR